MVTNCDRKSFGSRRKNSESCSDYWHRWRFWSSFRHYGTHFAESFRLSKSSWTMDQTHSREMPSWFSRNPMVFQDYLLNLSIIYWVDSVLGRPGRGTSQVEKSPRLNWATQFLTVVYDGACSLNVSLRMVWISFGALPCRKKKLNDSSRLHVVEIARVPWHGSFQTLKQEKTSAHEQTPLSNDTIDSVLRYR